MGEIPYPGFVLYDRVSKLHNVYMLHAGVLLHRIYVYGRKDTECNVEMEDIMKILAIESSSVTASVAVLTDDVLTAEYTINHKKTHSQTLLPMIDEICKLTETQMKDIDLIAVSAGPGSFTGLRIGSATGKGLGLAMDIPIVSVPTMDALAYNLAAPGTIVCAVMDAKRGNVYAGIYAFLEDNLAAPDILLPQSLISVTELAEKLEEMSTTVMLTGDASQMVYQALKETADTDGVIALPNNNCPRAASVAVLGKFLNEQRKAQNAREHLPEYLRPSQAERELAEKNEQARRN